MEQRRGGPSLAPPHRTWSRPKCNTFSLSEELCCFLCWSYSCGDARGSPGGRRSDGSDRYSSPGGECGAWVLEPGLGAWRPGQGRGVLAATYASARRAMGSIQKPRHGGTSDPGVSGSVLQLVLENSGGGGLVGGLAKTGRQRLNLNYPRSAVSAAASLAAATARPLGRCGMNGCTSRQAVWIHGTMACLPPSPGRAPAHSCPPGPKPS